MNFRLRGSSTNDQFAIYDHSDPARELIGSIHVVGHRNQGSSHLLLEFLDQLDDLATRDRIKSCRRIVIK